MLLSALVITVTVWLYYEARLKQFSEAVSIGALIFCLVLGAQ